MTASTHSIRVARQKREAADTALRDHDRQCDVCDVRRRVRCDGGRVLLHAFWDADAAARDEVTKANWPSELQLSLDEVLLGEERADD